MKVLLMKLRVKSFLIYIDKSDENCGKLLVIFSTVASNLLAFATV